MVVARCGKAWRSVLCASAADSLWETFTFKHTRIRGLLLHALLTAIIAYHYIIMGYWCPHCISIYTNLVLSFLLMKSKIRKNGFYLLGLGPDVLCSLAPALTSFISKQYSDFSIVQVFYIVLFNLSFLQPLSSDCSESTQRNMWADRYRQCYCKHEHYPALPFSSSSSFPL